MTQPATPEAPQPPQEQDAAADDETLAREAALEAGADDEEIAADDVGATGLAETLGRKGGQA
jgi:hypothetical protein